MSKRAKAAAEKKLAHLNAGRAGPTGDAVSSEWQTERLLVQDVVLDPDIQARKHILQEKVEEYASLLRKGKSLPPIDAFHVGDGSLLCADGFHRTLAHRLAGIDRFLVRSKPGSKADAILYAAGANHDHGLPRTREDVRRAIRMVLGLPEWGDRSSREVARVVRCDHKTVEAERRSNGIDSASGENPQTRVRKVVRGGKEFKARIAKKKPPTPSSIARKILQIDKRIEALFQKRAEAVSDLKVHGSPKRFGVSPNFKKPPSGS